MEDDLLFRLHELEKEIKEIVLEGIRSGEEVRASVCMFSISRRVILVEPTRLRMFRMLPCVVLLPVGHNIHVCMCVILRQIMATLLYSGYVPYLLYMNVVALSFHGRSLQRIGGHNPILMIQQGRHRDNPYLVTRQNRCEQSNYSLLSMETKCTSAWPYR